MQYKLLIAAGIAVTLAACASSAPRDRGYGYDGYGYGRDSGYYEPQRCYDCGQIERIVPVYGARQNSRTGAILGGVIGAVAARDIRQHGTRGQQYPATLSGTNAHADICNAGES